MSKYFEIWFNYVLVASCKEKIYASTKMYEQELKHWSHIFCNNGYPDWHIHDTIKSSKNDETTLQINWNLIFSLLEYYFLEKHVFARRLTALVKSKFKVLKLDHIFS